MQVVHVDRVTAELKRHLLGADAAVTCQRAGFAELRVDRVQRECICERADLRDDRGQRNPADVDRARHPIDSLHTNSRSVD